MVALPPTVHPLPMTHMIIGDATPWTSTGFSKFLSGVLGARASPRVILAGGLMATAVVNVGFGFGASYVWFMCFWALNGVLQARAWRGCCMVSG